MNRLAPAVDVARRGKFLYWLMLPESSGLDAYADRCLARPAYRKALEIGS